MSIAGIRPRREGRQDLQIALWSSSDQFSQGCHHHHHGVTSEQGGQSLPLGSVQGGKERTSLRGGEGVCHGALQSKSK